MKVIFAFILLSLLAFFGCNQKPEEAGKGVIVTVNNSKLTKSELEANIQDGTSKEDSLIVAENYIRSWVQDILMYDVAKQNVADKAEIEKLVENYRRSLIIYRYQEQLVQEKVSKTISQEEISKYYKENINNFDLDVPLVKGILLKIPINAPQINYVREWYKSKKQQDIEKLDKYIVKNAVSYDDFHERWIDWNIIKDKLPNNNLDVNILEKKFIELQDSSFCYFLNIQSFLLPGSTEPEEYAENYIREILVNQKKANFLKNMENDLYENALKKGKIKFQN